VEQTIDAFLFFVLLTKKSRDTQYEENTLLIHHRGTSG